MYDINLKWTAKMLKDQGLTDNEEGTYQALKEYWKDKIAIVWSVEDVKESLDGKYDLSDEEAIDILQEVFRSHDGGFGITWDTISEAADWVLERNENRKVQKSAVEELPVMNLKFDSSKRLMSERLKQE